VPWLREVDGIGFVNAGSVGRPKDGDPRASWAIAGWDGQALRAENVRTEYDVERAATAILESELPDAFADDLRRGGPGGDS
jgi:diadenosine tetraphosphatase ApaH/serine/threonine PP2A family protein phosphatase